MPNVKKNLQSKTKLPVLLEPVVPLVVVRVQEKPDLEIREVLLETQTTEQTMV